MKISKSKVYHAVRTLISMGFSKDSKKLGSEEIGILIDYIKQLEMKLEKIQKLSEVK